MEHLLPILTRACSPICQHQHGLTWLASRIAPCMLHFCWTTLHSAMLVGLRLCLEQWIILCSVHDSLHLAMSSSLVIPLKDMAHLDLWNRLVWWNLYHKMTVSHWLTSSDKLPELHSHSQSLLPWRSKARLPSDLACKMQTSWSVSLVSWPYVHMEGFQDCPTSLHILSPSSLSSSSLDKWTTVCQDSVFCRGQRCPGSWWCHLWSTSFQCLCRCGPGSTG